ncbi:MAG: hypothetical protein Q7T84_05710 [Phenylobacterium sp.]|uniref:hypothetical protein n=1 Tax=Phenylobacterium sp. TaxID=1871053 RepID=UPI00271A488A|nr:hypothetical protein [Phenylobacterium sp.]MDO9430777.1 hypothetical protein [Phenylobacterium sp.]
MHDPNFKGDLFLARLGSNYLLRVLANLTEAFDGDMVQAVVFMAISQAATDHLGLHREIRDFGGDGVIPDELRRPVTVLSIANSLQMPRETTRRHVTRLLERGYCVQVQGRRVMIPADTYRRPEMRQIVAKNRRDLLLLISTVRRANLLKEDSGEDG